MRNGEPRAMNDYLEECEVPFPAVDPRVENLAEDKVGEGGALPLLDVLLRRRMQFETLLGGDTLNSCAPLSHALHCTG